MQTPHYPLYLTMLASLVEQESGATAMQVLIWHLLEYIPQ